MSAPPLFETTEAAHAGLLILDYLSDLFTDAGKEEFSRVEILKLLNCVRDDQELFDPDAVVAFQIATDEIDQELRRE